MKFRFITSIAAILILCAQTFAQQDGKPFYREKLFWLNTAAAAGDCIASRVVVDGKRVREGNPLFADSDGTVSWKRAIPAKIAVVGIPVLVYKFSPRWGRRLMASSFAWHAGVLGYTVIIGFKYRW
jgi:hypothetical protein